MGQRPFPGSLPNTKNKIKYMWNVAGVCMGECWEWDGGDDYEATSTHCTWPVWSLMVACWLIALSRVLVMCYLALLPPFRHISLRNIFWCGTQGGIFKALGVFLFIALSSTWLCWWQSQLSVCVYSTVPQGLTQLFKILVSVPERSRHPLSWAMVCSVDKTASSKHAGPNKKWKR